MEGRIIVGAAVIDDVLGLVILTVVSGIAAGGTVSPIGAAKILAVAVGFLVVAIAIGGWVAPAMFRSVARMKVQDAVPVIALALCFALAGLADRPARRSSWAPSPRASSWRGPSSSTPSRSGSVRSGRCSRRSSS